MSFWLCKSDGKPAEIVEADERPRFDADKDMYGSTSMGYNTKEELIEDCKIQDNKCAECGGLIALNMSDKDEYEKLGICWSCYFWHIKIDISENEKKRQTIVDGEHYFVCDNDPEAAFQGFGGRGFFIVYNDGRIIKSNNTWYQGVIPNHFRNRLPDNAKFITREQYNDLVDNAIDTNKLFDLQA